MRKPCSCRKYTLNRTWCFLIHSRDICSSSASVFPVKETKSISLNAEAKLWRSENQSHLWLNNVSLFNIIKIVHAGVFVCVCVCMFSWLWVGPLAHNLSQRLGQWFKKNFFRTTTTHTHTHHAHTLTNHNTHNHTIVPNYIYRHTHAAKTAWSCDTHHNKPCTQKPNTPCEHARLRLCVCKCVCVCRMSLALLKFYDGDWP